MLRTAAANNAVDDRRHEELFLARYGRLRAWARQLTCDRQEEAEDLVHDAFIQFTFARPDLDAIQNLDGYLYRLLRNLHLSQVRRRLRLPQRALSIVDYDAVEIGLRANDPREQMRLQDELRQVCRYACLRKNTSKAGSVLILRFMHGYYPREIARVMRGSRPAVEERLRLARGEAKTFLENPSSLVFLRGAAMTRMEAESVYARTTDELLQDLRQTIFESCRGDCLTHAQLSKLYRADETDGREERETAERAAGETDQRATKAEGKSEGIDGATLAHIVSCRQCLDAVNVVLGLPLLAERYATDALGTDTHGRDGGDQNGGGRNGGKGSDKNGGGRDGGGFGGGGFGGGATGGGGGGGGLSGGEAETALRRCRRRARDVFEHRPQELCITVNGYLLATQRVGGEVCEQTLSVNLDERIDFIEIVSEQELRLLLLDVDDVPPKGAYRQTARIVLSDRRTLEATLSFSHPWPTVQVVYRDPSQTAESTSEHDLTAEEQRRLAPRFAALSAATTHVPSANETHAPSANGERATDVRVPPVENQNAPQRFGVRAWREWFARLSSRVSGGMGLLRFEPRAWVAALALVLVVTLVAVRLHVPTVSAAELLRRSASAEASIAADASEAVHRTITLEERRGAGGALVTRRRIETWQSASLSVSLRRVYDERNQLVAGAWTDADGTSTVYRRDAQPQHLAADADAKALLDAADIWRLTPSAADFSKLTGDAGRISVEERLGAYVLGYAVASGDRATNDGATDDGATRLLRATLTLTRADLHAIEQTVVVERAGEIREWRLIESGFERRPVETLAPALFQPEPELTGASRADATGETSKHPSDAAFATPASDETTDHAREARGVAPASATAASAASRELEIEVAYLLHQVKANLGEQVSMSRTASGALHVEALVETEQRKHDILRALDTVLRHPSVVVDVWTVEERLRRERVSASSSQTGQQSVREVEVTTARAPADAELRRYFAARLTGDERIEAEMKQASQRMMNYARQALLRASALQRLVERFSPAETRALDASARAKWVGMIREHTHAYRRANALLAQDIRMYFGAASAVASQSESAHETDARRAAVRLLELSYAHDETVRAALTISAEQRTATAIKSSPFMRSLAASEKLAAAILAAYE